MVEETEALQSLQTLQWQTQIIPPLIAILLGIIGEFILLPWLRRRAEKRQWRSGLVFFNALRWHVLLWMLMLAVVLAVRGIPLQPRVFTTIYTTIGVILRLSLTLIFIQVLTWYVRLFISTRDVPSVPLINTIIRVVGGLVFLAVLMSTLNYPITPWLTVIAGSSLGLSLALRDPLGNLFSGLLLVASNRIRPGNYIKLNSGEEGYVTDISWHTTTIRQLPNTMVIVPNAVMVSATIINFDEPEKELSILLDVGVSYDSDLKHVERVTIEVATETLQEVTGGVASFDPFIRYNDFSDSSINFTVILRGTEFVDQYIIKHEFIKRLHERYNQEGIVIPFPIRTLHTPAGHPVELRNGAALHRIAEPDRKTEPALEHSTEAPEQQGGVI
jgi:small-conductance mechanosensitive channel